MPPKKQALSRLVVFLAYLSVVSGSLAYRRRLAVDARQAAACSRIRQVTRCSSRETANPGFGADIGVAAEFTRLSAGAASVVTGARRAGAARARFGAGDLHDGRRLAAAGETIRLPHLRSMASIRAVAGACVVNEATSGRELRLSCRSTTPSGLSTPVPLDSNVVSSCW